VRTTTSDRRTRANSAILAEVGAALRELKDSSDFNGLLRAQALARAIASTSEGSLQRKAARMAKKAGVAAEKARKDSDAAVRSPANGATSTAVSPLSEQAAPILTGQAEVEREGATAIVDDLGPTEHLPVRESPLPEPVTAAVAAPVIREAMEAPAQSPEPATNGASTTQEASAGAPTEPELAADPVQTMPEPPVAPASMPKPVANGGEVAAATVEEPPAASRPQRLDEAAVHVLFGRITALLQLLAQEDDPPCGRVALAELGDDPATLSAGLSRVAERWGRALLEGYEAAWALPGTVILGVLRNQHRQQIRRELKQIAVDSLARGVNVAGVAADAVPVVAYALLLDRLPTGIESGSPEAAERTNDLLLGVLGGMAAPLDTEASQLFIDLFGLTVALGEAQRYADQLGVAGLSVGRQPSGRRLARRTAFRAAAAVCAAVLLGVAGFALGAADGGRKATAGAPTVTQRAHPVTVTRERVVTRPGKVVTRPGRVVTLPGKVVTRPGKVVTTTVIRTKHVPPTVVDHTKTVADVSTVTVTTTAPSAAPSTTTRIVDKNVVPAACATAIADARQMALLAVNGFSQFTSYAALASQAIPAAAAHDTAKMARIAHETEQLGSSLSQRAHEIARLGDAVSAASAACG
jgi:hypothetical protein